MLRRFVVAVHISTNEIISKRTMVDNAFREYEANLTKIDKNRQNSTKLSKCPTVEEAGGGGGSK